MNDRRLDSFTSLLVALVQLVLLLLGMIGISVHLFRQNGWISQIVGHVLETWSFTAIAAIPLLAAAYLILTNWYTKNFTKDAQEKVTNLMLFAMMGVGAFFLFRLISSGSFTG